MIKKEDYQKCPLCGSSMHLVKGKFGTFLACDRYHTEGCKGRADDPNRAEFTAKSKAKKEALKEQQNEENKE